MNTKGIFTKLAVAGAVATLVGCAAGPGTDQNAILDAELKERADTLASRADALASRESALQQRESALSNATQSNVTQNTNAAATGDLLPPNAKSGECYARVWVPEQFKTVSEQVLATDAYERIATIPATYEWGTETVEVSPASSRLVNIPAVYGTETERVLMSDEQIIWRLALNRKSAIASGELLALAKKYGASIDSATPGMCFHEHYTPAKYETVNEEILASAESESISVIPATYRSVEKTILVSEASSKVVQLPATFKTETSRMLVKPAHTIWKKGTGPVQRIDSATGEIMCLVEVPAVYKTISKRVIDTPATVRTVEIPAQYKAVKVTELVSSASEERTKIPATYKTLSRRNKISDASVVWHEVHNKEHPTATRTGQQVCLTKVPAVYKTVSRKIVETPASTREVLIAAKSKAIKVRKLKSAATEERTPIPATYKTVTHKELVSDGYMQWRSILCETNTTPRRIAQIQTALKAKGFNPGSIDGVVGASTIRAVNAFQKANKLPVDKYLNVQTIRALGVAEK